MDDNIRSLLTSSDPAERLRGMDMLVQSGDPDTLKILHQLYKSDSDPDVKAQAAAYGKQLQDVGGMPEKPKKKAPRDPAGAERALQAAENDLMNLDYDGAKLNAQRAFMLDPSLQHDERAVNIAADITGTMKSVAVDTLMQDAQRPANSMAYAGTNMPGTAQEQVGCTKALLDVSLYAGLQAILFLIGALLVSTFTNAILDALDVPLNTIPFAIAGTVAVFLFQALALMLWMALIHFCATAILKGKGFYTNLLHNVRNPMIVYFIVSTVVSIVAFFAAIGFSLGALTDVANAFGEVDVDRLAVAIENGDDRAMERELLAVEQYIEDNADDIENFAQRMEQGQAISGIINLVNGVIGLGFMVWLSIKIGKTYDFGGGKGCVSIILSYLIPMLVCGCAFCGIFFLASSATSG